MRRLGSAALAGLLPLLGVVPVIGLAQDAQPVYQPTPAPGVAPPPAVIPPPTTGAVSAVAVTPAPAPALYTAQQLDQMLAPIALYPDSLLTQILMAATYPTQIVEADRWLANPANAAIHGDMLVAVLTPIQWDPSVKSLIPFPQIVRQMNDNLDWTQSLGTAFAGQEADVMARVQVLRSQAAAAGKLVSTPQLRVIHESTAWVIEPADPAVVYVPVYNPTIVFGPWAYVDYPPVYFAPAPGFFFGEVGVGIGFSVGFGVVGPLWGWGHPAWDGGTVVVNNTYYSRISYNNATVAGGTWSHQGSVALVQGAGFHAPGSPAFRSPSGGFRSATPTAAGFRGAAPAATGFRGAAPAGGLRSPAPSAGFHGPTTSTGFHAPAASGTHAPASSGFHAPASSGFHAPASSGGYHPPGGGVTHAQPSAGLRGPSASAGYRAPGGGMTRPQPAASGFRPPGGGMTHPQPSGGMRGPAPAVMHAAPPRAPAVRSAPSGGGNHHH